MSAIEDLIDDRIDAVRVSCRVDDWIERLHDLYAQGSVWARIMQLYEARNHIAHGTLGAKGINVAVQAQQMFQLQSQL